jgi:hypothetical protein
MACVMPYNGVIIDISSRVISGIISRGISVDARAIRLSMPPEAGGHQSWRRQELRRKTRVASCRSCTETA